MRVNAFSKTYGGRTVLEFPGFDFAPGRIYAVIGANGSGKTTFARCLCGIERADGGSAAAAPGTAVGYLPQKSFAFRMSTRKNIRLGADAQTAEALMEELGLLPYAASPAYRLSGGETAKMALARILPRKYDLLALDEPTAAMDMESTLAAERLIVRRCRETGMPILCITHSLQQARRTADEVLFFHRGRLLEHGAAETLLSAPRTPELRQFLEFYGAV